MNRNRILSGDGSWKYFIVPIKKGSYTNKINETLIDYSQKWEDKNYGTIRFFIKKAPYYEQVISMLELLFQRKYDSISELNIQSTKLVMDYLNINKEVHKLSEMDIDVSTVKEPDDWGVVVSKKF